MKKLLTFTLMGLMALSILQYSTEAKTNSNEFSVGYATTKANRQSKKYDIIKDKEYAQIKRDYFSVEEYGDIYNCQVEKQKFCKVKDLESGFYVLCDRDVTRTQMESAKLFYQLGRCVKMN